MAASFVRIDVSSLRVAIVGAGLAGLSAALALKDAGVHVELFERSRLLGGRATSFELDGHIVDNGQHVYLACCSAFIRFVERAGMGHALRLQERFDVVAYSKNGLASRLRAADLPAPFHLLASFARYKHLSLGGKLRIARALVSLMLDPHGAGAQMTFAQWLRSHGQNEQTVRSFWEPFLVPALNAPLDRMNAADAAFVISTAFLHDRGAARFGYSTVPLARIAESAAVQTDRVHRSSAVLAVEADDRSVLVRTAAGETRFDAAVLAVSPRGLARLLPDHAALGVPPLDVYEPFAIMDAHLWYDGPPLTFDFAALLDSPVQWIFQKSPGYLCCSLSAADNLVSRPNSQIVAAVWEKVRTAVPALAGSTLLRGAATRNPEGTYLVRTGAVKPGGRTALSSLAIAGAWTATGWPDTMESAVRSGENAAQVLLHNKSDTMLAGR